MMGSKKVHFPILRIASRFQLSYAQPDIASHLRIPSFDNCGHIVEIAFCGLKMLGRKNDDDCDMIRRIAIINRIEQNDIADCWPCLHAFPQPKRIEFCPFLPAAHPTKTMRRLFCLDRQIVSRKQNAVIYKCSTPAIVQGICSAIRRMEPFREGMKVALRSHHMPMVAFQRFFFGNFSQLDVPCILQIKNALPPN